jgi:uncharacterized protein YecT (DUF1311 family)
VYFGHPDSRAMIQYCLQQECSMADSMSRNLLLLVALVAASGSSSPATGKSLRAQSQSVRDPCANAMTQMEMNQCADRQGRQAQGKLDALLKELAGVLEKGEGTRLAAVQKAWASYRDAHCEWQASVFEGGSIQPMERLTCFSSVTWNRIDELKWNLCEGHGMTGECAASRRYARSAK